MENKFIQEYGEDILCYRFRTERQKKRVQYKNFDKQLIALHKEERALYQQKRNLGWEPLIPPVQKGWKRFFTVRDDVARGRHGFFFENILAKINTKDWCHRKDFRIKKRKYGRKKYVVKEQKLLQPDEPHFLKLDFSETEKQFFHEEYHFERWKKTPLKRYVFNDPWRFVLRIRPNMIDKVRLRDEWLEARLKQIDNYLERNDYRKRQTKLLHGSGKWKCWKSGEIYDEVNPLKNIPLCQILDQVKNELL
jgi:hypothetical protein